MVNYYGIGKVPLYYKMLLGMSEMPHLVVYSYQNINLLTWVYEMSHLELGQ